MATANEHAQLQQEVDLLFDAISPETSGATPLDQQIARSYERLRGTARALLAAERSHHTLSTDGVLNEAIIKLLRYRENAKFADERYFYAAMRRAMTRVLVEYSRSRKRHVADARKRVVCEDLDLVLANLAEHEIQPDELREALDELERLHPREAEALQLAVYCGWKHVEIAEKLGVSTRTVQNDLRFARTWLSRWARRA